MTDHLISILSYLGVGALVGLGQALTLDMSRSTRFKIGVVVTHATIGLSAASVLSVLPTMAFVAQMGVAALISSMGANGLKALFDRFMKD